MARKGGSAVKTLVRSRRSTLGAMVMAMALICLAGATRAQTADQDSDTEAGAPSAVPGNAPPDPVWPHRFEQGDLEFTVYPPQLERWQADRLEARAAVAVQASASDEPTFGMVSLSARTEIDQAGDRVRVSGITANRASFPTATERAGAYLDALRQHLAQLSWSMPVERLRADLEIDRTARQTGDEALRNEPPRILYSASPAVLVSIDGEPVLREMAGLDLLRVLNTRALILLEKLTGRYFIFVAERWLQATSLEGPWSEAHVRPSALDDAKEEAVAGGQVDLLEDADADDGPPLRVVVSTRPAELVQTDGEPEYSPIAGTQLLYVTNSPDRLFLDLPTQQHYVLLAGRWYRTRSLEHGGWEYVAGASLPGDFGRIPNGHPAASVRAAVPGSPQAQEAVIANAVPQVATVKRTAAKLEIEYDGPPQFRAIEGTALEYAANAPVPVIRVDSRSFYALDNGIWFFAESSAGPWTAATSVPAAIYTIPPSSPLHYVTYVRIYDSTRETVSVGYTPGYVGSYVTSESTVVYGTGWVYRPWIGTVWYSPPVTWGFGFSYWRTWWNPWRPVRWVGHRPHPCFHPAWGPWTPRVVARRPVVTAGASIVVGNTGVTRGAGINADNVSNIYRRWGPRTVVARHEPRRFAGPPSAAAPVAGIPANPDWQIQRRRDGQWQRFDRNGRWERSDGPRRADVSRWTGGRADEGRRAADPSGQTRWPRGLAQQDSGAARPADALQPPAQVISPPSDRGRKRVRPHRNEPPPPIVREPRPIIETPTPQQPFVVPPLGGTRPPMRQPPASRPPSASPQRGGRLFTPPAPVAGPAERGAPRAGPRFGGRSSAGPRINHPRPAAATQSPHGSSARMWRGGNGTARPR
jgi:hypothetical protein